VPDEVTYLAVPPSEYHMARAMGVQFDERLGAWFVGAGLSLDHVARWLPDNAPVNRNGSHPPATAAPTTPPASDPIGREDNPTPAPELPIDGSEFVDDSADAPRSLHDLAVIGMTTEPPAPRSISTVAAMMETQPSAPEPVSSTPVSSTPVSSTPVSSTPVPSTPVPSTPVPSTPVSSTPVPSTPVPSTPVPSTPAQGLKPPAEASAGSFNPFGAVGESDDSWEAAEAPAVPISFRPTVVQVDRPTATPGDLSPVSVLGMRIHCYRCGSLTTAIVGIGIPPETQKGRRGRRRGASVTAWRFVPLPDVAVSLAAVLPPDWFRLVFAGAITLRRADDAGPEGEHATWCNGCATCDAMLTDSGIQAAFAEALPASGQLQSFALDTVYLPEADLESALRGR